MAIIKILALATIWIIGLTLVGIIVGMISAVLWNLLPESRPYIRNGLKMIWPHKSAEDIFA